MPGLTADAAVLAELTAEPADSPILTGERAGLIDRCGNSPTWAIVTVEPVNSTAGPPDLGDLTVEPVDLTDLTASRPLRGLTGESALAVMSSIPDRGAVVSIRCDGVAMQSRAPSFGLRVVRRME